MRTSEDARQSGLYASDCCDAELIFIQGDTFWRCPRCQRLCDWELLEATASRRNLESLRLVELRVADSDQNMSGLSEPTARPDVNEHAEEETIFERGIQGLPLMKLPITG